MPTRVRLTQNVTDGDIRRGSLRVPRDSKDIFPLQSAKIRVIVGAEWYTATWNPHTDPDKERSGTIYLGRATLTELFTEGGPREITTLGDGYRID